MQALAERRDPTKWDYRGAAKERSAGRRRTAGAGVRRRPTRHGRGRYDTTAVDEDWTDRPAKKRRLTVVSLPGRHHDDIASRFDRLASTWERETALESFITRAAVHPAYQQIIGLGPVAVPLILARLEQESKPWFWALTAITGKNPAEGTETVDEATRLWLDWGRATGKVP